MLNAERIPCDGKCAPMYEILDPQKWVNITKHRNVLVNKPTLDKN